MIHSCTRTYNSKNTSLLRRTSKTTTNK